ncbi:BTB/POZ protein [Russula earlei]|uniref:BTB/POZ protein n=1 Tax=Russula earlei TaxID=71964 RepID=A0ACC0TXV9_9AGAM|nr:BTB/POZ protein [Russula earlei]
MAQASLRMTGLASGRINSRIARASDYINVVDYVRHPMSSSSPSQDDWIRVTSRDGFSFIVKRSVVFFSGTLRNMLDERHSFTEAVQKVCPVDERAAVTEKFVEYLTYKATYENVPSNEEIPDFQERIAPEIALELASCL